MLNRFLTAAAAIATLVGASPATAQEAAEIYVPIGQSPGVSGKISVIGTVRTMDAAARTLTLEGPGGTQTFAITATTRIWQDRSASKQSNKVGSPADLQPGRRIEVKPLPSGADWIKVQVPAGG